MLNHLLTETQHVKKLHAKKLHAKKLLADAKNKLHRLVMDHTETAQKWAVSF